MASTEPRTLLLFCPYDKKVTRHTRRGPKLQMVCVECGRGVEADAGEPAAVRTARSRRAGSVAPPPEIPDLAAILAAAAPERAPMRTRRSSSMRAVSAEPATNSAPEGLRRTPQARRPKAQGIHPILMVAAAFFAALALANVIGNLLGGGQGADSRIVSEVTATGGRIANTDGQGVYLRGTPNFEDRLPNALPEGMAIRVIGVESLLDGVAWRQVEDAGGVRGWVPSQYVTLS